MRKKTAVILVVALVVVGALSFGAWKDYEWLVIHITPNVCYLQADGAEEPFRLTNEQARDASIIVAESYSRDLSEQAVVIALATAWQGSGLRNLNYSGRNSLGLFQQRPSYDWSTKEQIMDPWYSSGRFYEELVKFDDWENTDVNGIAQKVQYSGHPEAYRKYEINARALTGAFRGSKESVFARINQDTTGADHSNPDKAMATVPGGSLQDDGSELAMTASNAGTAWSTTQLALTSASKLGVEKVNVGGGKRKQGERTQEDVQPVSSDSMTVTIKPRS